VLALPARTSLCLPSGLANENVRDSVLSKRINIAELLGEDQLDEVVFALCEGIHKKLEFIREKMSSEGILQEGLGLFFVACLGKSKHCLTKKA